MSYGSGTLQGAEMAKKDLSLKGEILLYQGKDGITRIETRFVDESVWLSLKELSELFGIDKSGISINSLLVGTLSGPDSVNPLPYSGVQGHYFYTL